MTRPITTTELNPREKEVTVTLMEESRRWKSFESTQRAGIRYVLPLRYRPLVLLFFSLGSHHRASLESDVVLGKVATLVKRFVYQVSILCGLPETTANAAGGKIFTVDSYPLGVHSPGSVIDILCILPKRVSTEKFFDVFERTLGEMYGATEVSVGCSISSPFSELLNLCSHHRVSQWRTSYPWSRLRQ